MGTTTQKQYRTLQNLFSIALLSFHFLQGTLYGHCRAFSKVHAFEHLGGVCPVWSFGKCLFDTNMYMYIYIMYICVVYWCIENLSTCWTYSSYVSVSYTCFFITHFLKSSRISYFPGDLQGQRKRQRQVIRAWTLLGPAKQGTASHRLWQRGFSGYDLTYGSLRPVL